MTDMTERKEPLWDVDWKTVNSMADHLKVAEQFGAISANCISQVNASSSVMCVDTILTITLPPREII